MQKQSKYRSVKQNYNGRNYDSKLEAAWAQFFDVLKKAGEIIEIEPQYVVELVAYDSTGKPAITKKWRVDFRLLLPDGKFHLVEVKGFPTTEYKWKEEMLLKLWLPDHPDYTYEVMKGKPRYGSG